MFGWFALDRSTIHPKFNRTGNQTHDLQIIDTTFHVPEMLILTTEPPPLAPVSRLRSAIDQHENIK